MKKTLILAALALSAALSASAELTLKYSDGNITAEDATITLSGDSALTNVKADGFTVVITLDGAYVGLVGSGSPRNEYGILGMSAGNNTAGFGTGYSSNGNVTGTSSLFGSTSKVTTSSSMDVAIRSGNDCVLTTIKGKDGVTKYNMLSSYVVYDSTTQTGRFADGITGMAITMTYKYSDFTDIYVTFSKEDGSGDIYHIADNGLGWNSGFNTIDTLTLNTNFVESVSVYSGHSTQAEAIQLNNKVLGIPEPASATLSLLALAGLATRRRRK